MNKFLKLSVFFLLVFSSTQVVFAKYPTDELIGGCSKSPLRTTLPKVQVENNNSKQIASNTEGLKEDIPINQEKIDHLQGYSSTAKAFIFASKKAGKFVGAATVGAITYVVIPTLALTFAEAVAPYAVICLFTKTCLINPLLTKMITANFVVEASPAIRFALSAGASTLGADVGSFLGYNLSKTTVDAASYTSKKVYEGLSSASSFLLKKTTEGASYAGKGLFSGLKSGVKKLSSMIF